MRKTHCTLVQMAGAAALALTLALTGCGQAETEEPASKEEPASAEEMGVEVETGADEAEAESKEAGDDVVFSEDAEAGMAMARSRMVSADKLGTVDTNAIEVAEDSDLAVEEKETVVEGDGDQSKAGNNTLMTTGGMELQLPEGWYIKNTDTGFKMMSADGAVNAEMFVMKKESGYTYDVTAMAGSIPSLLTEAGAENVRVDVYDVLYSSTNTLVDSYIQISCIDGGVETTAYYEYLESKNYITGLFIYAPSSGWRANYSDICTIVNSVCFADGEAI